MKKTILLTAVILSVFTAKAQYVDPLHLHERLVNLVSQARVGAIWTLRDEFKDKRYGNSWIYEGGQAYRLPDQVEILYLNPPFVRPAEDRYLLREWGKYTESDARLIITDYPTTPESEVITLNFSKFFYYYTPRDLPKIKI